MNLACILLGLWCSSGTITGHATAYDGDTIYVANQAVRLAGIDAEELDEPHGVEARDHLRSLIGNRTVTCRWDGWSYNRKVGICYVNTPGAVTNLNLTMVAHGFALDCGRYSNDGYRIFEPKEARTRLRQKPYC